MSEKRFILDSDFVKVTSQVVWDNQEEKGLTLMKLVDLLNEQQATIENLKDNVYDELDKALKILEEVYEDYPKNNVHRLYNNLKGLKEMVK